MPMIGGETDRLTLNPAGPLDGKQGVPGRLR